MSVLPLFKPPVGEAPSQGAPSGPDRIEGALLALARDYGFYSGLYAHLGHALGAGVPMRFAASSAVARRQFGEALPASGVARRAAGSHHPFAWSSRDERIGVTDWAYAGIAIPVQDHAAGPALVALIGVDAERAAAIVADCTPDLMATAVMLHLAARCELAPLRKRDMLTQREIECLRFASLGQTVPVSADQLGITPRTVEFHLKNACEKLGATNKVHAVAIATSRGLIRV